MEPPASWNLLTASLAISDLDKPNAVWAFLVLQGLVRDEPGDRETFVGLVHEVLLEGPITGPSEASRVAIELGHAALVLPAGELADPWAVIAAQRINALATWGGAAVCKEKLSRFEQGRQLMMKASGQPPPSGATAPGNAGRKPWWKFWQ